jgi:hypothetical protein
MSDDDDDDARRRRNAELITQAANSPALSPGERAFLENQARILLAGKDLNLIDRCQTRLLVGLAATQ